MAGNPNWTKGQSANPAGRPKKEHSLTHILEQIGSEPVDETGLTRKQALARLMWSKALDDGDMPAMKYIYDRIDGSPKQAVEMTGADGDPIEVVVKFDK